MKSRQTGGTLGDRLRNINPELSWGELRSMPRTREEIDLWNAVKQYEREMEEEAIPQIIQAVKRRQALAADARLRIMGPSAEIADSATKGIENTKGNQ